MPVGPKEKAWIQYFLDVIECGEIVNMLFPAKCVYVIQVVFYKYGDVAVSTRRPLIVGIDNKTLLRTVALLKPDW